MNLDFLRRRPHLAPCLIAAGLLFYATGHRPYAFYELMRIGVFVVAALVAWIASQGRIVWATGFFVGLALLFNPLAPVRLRRATWAMLDPVCAGVFLAGAAVPLGGNEK